MIYRKYIFGFMGIIALLVIMASILPYLQTYFTGNETTLIIIALILVGISIVVIS